MAAELDPPLEINWHDPAELGDGAPGRLGLTSLPGKHGTSERYPGRVYRRDLGHDLATLHAAGVRDLVLLVTDAELARWGDPQIVERGAAAGVRIWRHPHPDGTAPGTMAAMDLVLDRLATARADADAAVACMGGVGRTGTVAACALVRAGLSADAAITRVRAVRHPEAVETPEQEAFVRAYERHVAEPHRGSAKVAP